MDRLENGLGLYRYKYVWSDQAYVGVMAQGVTSASPEAVVVGEHGYIVDDLISVCVCRTWEEWSASNQSASTAH